MRKVLIGLLIVVGLVIVGCSDTGGSQEEPVNTLQASEVHEKVQEQEVYAFILGDNSCPACATYKASLVDLVEDKGIKLDYIDLLQETGDDYQAVNELLADELGIDLSQGISTPTTYFVVNGELQDELVGSVPVEELIEQYGDHLEAMD